MAMSAGQATLRGIIVVPIPFVTKVERSIVSLISPDCLYLKEQGTHGAHLAKGMRIWPP